MNNPRDIKILYLGRGFVAVDKPYGIPTIPGRQGEISVKEILSSSMGRLLTVHRLDRLTSGVLLFARDESAHRYINYLFAQRKVQKEYLCIVQGKVNKDFEVDLSIRQFGSGRMGFDPKGKKALTRFVPIGQERAYSLLSAFPVTGRRHQIRVHLYLKGLPIVGDPLYGQGINKGYPRMMLHSYRVSFLSQEGGLVSITSPLPQEFKELLSPEVVEGYAPRNGSKSR